MKKLIPLSLLAICTGLIFLLRWAELEKILRFPTRYVGLVPVLGGAALAVVALRHLAKAGTTVKAFEQPDKLVTGGIFCHSRNPIYLGLTLILVGICVLVGARCLLVPAMIFILVVDRWVIRAEERMLHRKFGQDYTIYCSKTRRWI